jgi:hypothetical protein
VVRPASLHRTRGSLYDLPEVVKSKGTKEGGFVRIRDYRFWIVSGTEVFDWTVDIDDQTVLSRVKNVMVIRGAQGIYEANSPGQAMLTAVGSPFYRNSVPACMEPSMLFKITVIVQ